MSAAAPQSATGMLPSFPWGRAALVITIATYVFVGGVALAGTPDPLSGAHIVIPLGIALAPICIFLTFRYPLIFPFGLYLLLAPVDALLTASGAFTLVKLVGALSIGALLLRIVLLRRVLMPPRAFYWWLALVGYATLSIAWAPDFFTGPATYTYPPMMNLFAMMAVLAIYPAEPREFKVMLALTVLSGVLVALYTLSQYHPQDTSTEVGRVALVALDNTSVEDPNYLGGAFFLPFALAVAGVFYMKNVALRVASGLAIPPMLGAVLTTGSRGALVGVGVIALYYVIRSRYRIAAACVALAGLVMTALIPAARERFANTDLLTADGRTDIWRTGLHNLGDHWLFGAGFGSYQYEYDRNLLQVAQSQFAGWGRPGHSLIFVALNDFGIVGLCLVLASWWFGFRQLRAIPETSWLFGPRLALEAALIGLFLLMLSLDPTFVKYVWLTQSLPLMVLNLNGTRLGGAVRARKTRTVMRFPAARLHEA